MAVYYKESDVDKKYLKGKKIAILGFGNQGHAHALNLRDSGCDVIVGARAKGQGAEAARAAGFKPISYVEAVEQAEIVSLLVSDLAMAEVYNEIQFSLKIDATLLFAHGFAIRFNLITPREDLHVALVSPKGAGAKLRATYEQGSGLAALIAVRQDPKGEALKAALAYGSAIGCARVGMLQTTFAEETETDLFGEQSVLCGALPELLKMGFETLVEAGYQPEVAYFECVHEAKLIMDLIFAGTLESMRNKISDTAEYGGFVTGPKLINEDTRKTMREILAQIREGEFAKEWLAEDAAGRPFLKELRSQESEHTVDKVATALRKEMPKLGQ